MDRIGVYNKIVVFIEKQYNYEKLEINLKL